MFVEVCPIGIEYKRPNADGEKIPLKSGNNDRKRGQGPQGRQPREQ